MWNRAALLTLLTSISVLAWSPEKKAAAKPAEVTGSTASPTNPAPVDPKTYVIGAEDLLLIQVWREAELSKQVMVRPDGKISLQLVNEVQASGLTPEQLSASITEGLSKFMTRPEVTVSVQAVNSKKYYLSGEVLKPGSYPLLIPTNVLQALVNAGGFRDFADTKKIFILRGNKRLSFNYKEVIRGKHTDQNILLESGDHIVVP